MSKKQLICLIIALLVGSAGCVWVQNTWFPVEPEIIVKTEYPSFSEATCDQLGYCTDYCSAKTDRLDTELTLCSEKLRMHKEIYPRAKQRIYALMKENTQLKQEAKTSEESWEELNHALEYYAEVSMKTVCAEEILHLSEEIDASTERYYKLMSELRTCEVLTYFCSEKHNCNPTDTRVTKWWEDSMIAEE